MLNKISLDAFTLKLIALITMTIDHYGYFIQPDVEIFRIIGRVSFVIFAYFIANGYLHTSNKLKHGLTLLIFGIIIDILLLASNNYEYSNIFITLSFGYFLIYGFEQKKYYICIIVLLLANFIFMDYGYYGILLIFACYYYFNDIFKLIFVNIILCYLAIVLFNFSYIQYYSIFGLLLLLFYNNKRGLNFKYFFYIYYPLHIVILSYMANVK